VAIPNKVGEQSWAKISSKIDRIARLPSESRTNAKDQKEQHEWSEVSCTEVAVILQCEDHEHKYRACDELGEELTSLRHKSLGIRAEYTSGRVLSGNSPNIRAALVKVDGGLVVAVNDRSATEAACYLSASICRQFTPGELPEHTVCESDSRIQVSSRTACSVNPEHHAYTPAEGCESVLSYRDGAAKEK
jgi:hypothetical protein